MLQQNIYDEGFDEGDDSQENRYQISILDHEAEPSDLLLDDVNLLEWLQNPAFQLAAYLLCGMLRATALLPTG